MEREHKAFLTKEMFPSFSAEMRYIKKFGVNGKIIEKIVKKYEPKKQRMLDLYSRYKLVEDGIPIANREFEDQYALNEKINNDYFSEIINTTVGFLATKFSYNYSKDGENHDKNYEVLKNFITRNSMSNIDMETIKFANICGVSGRLMYINPEGEESVKLIYPYEVIVLTDKEVFEPEFALRVIDTEEINENMEVVTCKKVEFYDNTNIYYFKTDNKGEYIPDVDEQGRHVAPHLFDYCPLQLVPNNMEMMGTGEKVLAAIDAVDRAISDCNTEIEAFKLAYMIITGAQADDEVIEQAKRTGAFNLPNSDVKIEYLVKNINDTFVENHLNRLDKNIYRFSQTPNITDESFGTSVSGVAMKFRLFPLETRISMFLEKLDSANRYMFKVLASAWKKKAIDFDYLSVWIEYKTNTPLDLEYYTRVLTNLKGNVSDETALGLMPFVDDTEYEIELMKKEQEERMALMQPLDFDSEVDNDKEKEKKSDMPETSAI